MSMEVPQHVTGSSRRSIMFEDGVPSQGLAELQLLPPRRPVMRVSSMRGRSSSIEGLKSRVDSPAALHATVNPQYTFRKACELYGGAPRPLSARHEFCRKAFLADTEDWRSHANIGSANSAIARMNITDSAACTYLEEAAGRKLSYYRERSLARAVSYRATMVKKNGDLADSQYADQYVDKETVSATLRRQQSRGGHRPSSAPGDALVAEALGKSLSCAPDRVLTTQLSRMSRPGSTPSGESPKALRVEDKGMARAVSRIMTRARSIKLASAAAVAAGSSATLREDDESVEEAPRMDDI